MPADLSWQSGRAFPRDAVPIRFASRAFADLVVVAEPRVVVARKRLDGVEVTCSLPDTPPNRVRLIRAYVSAQRVQILSDRALEGLVERLEAGDYGAARMGRVRGLFNTSDRRPARMAALRNVYERGVRRDEAHIRSKLRAFCAKHYSHLPVHALDPPPPHRARNLWLGAWPDKVDILRNTFQSSSHRGTAGGFLKHCRQYLRETGLFYDMLLAAYPLLKREIVEDLCLKTEKHGVLIHIDHFLAFLSDEPFHFVVMIAPANTGFGATNMFVAKDLYVSEDVAGEIREIAAGVRRGVRARPDY